MKILIAGSDLNAKLLARYLKLENSNNDIYITTEEQSADDTYTCINIKENDIAGICDFVKYNQIEFTIATSSIAIINGIADEFKKEGFLVFAPYSEAERITYFNSIAKKIMYKLKINTPKFGIFDRENLAIEYVRKARFPIVISNDFTLLSRESSVYKTFSQAKLGIQKIFENSNNDKIVIENYIQEDPVYIYFITDGYNALPLISISRLSGKNYTTATAPSPKIDEDIIINILQQVIYPLLDDISKYTDMYIGILGLKIKIYKNNIYVLEFYNGFQHYDFQAFISLLDENLLNLLYDTVTGCLSDNHDYIRLKDNFSYSAAINKSEIKSEESYDEDFIESEDKEKYIYTSTASTVNKAKENLYDFLETIITEETTQNIIKANNQKEIKI